MEALLQIGMVVLLGLVGLTFGSLAERRHYRRLRRRESELAYIHVFNEKRPPADVRGQPFHLVQGSVVISSDYFKTLAAGLKGLFGGNLDSWETLLDRGRREAILRMKAQAQERSANLVMNVRFETSMLFGNRRGIRCCEVLVWGTAFHHPQLPLSGQG